MYVTVHAVHDGKRVCGCVTLVLKRRFMTPLDRRSPVRSDGRHTDTLLLSRLDRADSASSLPLATDRAKPDDRMRKNFSWSQIHKDKMFCTV